MASKLSKNRKAILVAVSSVAAKGEPTTVHYIAVAAGREDEENHVFSDLQQLVEIGRLIKHDNCYQVLA